MHSRVLASPPVHGILAAAYRLGGSLHLVFALLVVASAARYVQGHGWGSSTGSVLGVVALLATVYAYPAVVQRRASVGPGSGVTTTGLSPLWCLTMVLLWSVLVLLAPSFAWVAVPLSFVALRDLQFTTACVLIAAMVGTVVVAWSRMVGQLDPTILAGPLSVAVLVVVAYRALEQDVRVRQTLLDELRQAEGERAAAEHEAGVLAERARLSREIHDSVGQDLSSIHLLLQAAELDWTSRSEVARQHVRQAAITARAGLEEVRRVMSDHAAEGSTETPAGELHAALRRTCSRAALHSPVRVELVVHGDAAAVPSHVTTALVRTARGALANVVEHADARTAVVSLTYQPDSVTLDVRDDGVGFHPDAASPAAGRGRGLAGIRSRVQELGGEAVVESAPGDGTTLAVRIPLEGGDGEPWQ